MELGELAWNLSVSAEEFFFIELPLSFGAEEEAPYGGNVEKGSVVDSPALEFLLPSGT